MSGPVQPPLTVETVDGTTSGRPITKIKVSNGTLSISGSTATITTDGGGGSTPGGSTGSIQYNDGAGGFAGSSKMIYDDADAKITLTSAGNALFIDAGGSPQLSFNGTGTGNIPTISGDGGRIGGTGLLIMGNNTVSNNYMWFNRSADQIQLIAPSASESIKISSNLGGDIEITATGGSQDVILSAATGNVKIEGLSYPTSDGTANQILKTDGAGVLSFTDAVSSVGLTETGSALSITGSPITTSGTINIAGAGTSSQVILGDLTLGTLTSGTVTGTGIANQVSYWTSTTAQAGSSGLTYNPSTGDLTVGGYVEVGTKVTTPSGTNLTLEPGGASSGSIVIADGANGQISITGNGTSVIKLGQSTNTVTVSNAYTLPNVVTTDNGYVLTAQTDGTTAWAASGGGGGGSSEWNVVNTQDNINASYTRHVVSKNFPWGRNSGGGTGTTGTIDEPTCRPFISPISGDVTEIGIVVDTADATGVTNMLVGVYSDTNGAPNSLLSSAVMNCTATGSVYQTSFTGTATLVKGTQYWIVSVRNNSTNTIAVSGEPNHSMSWVGGSSSVTKFPNQQSCLVLASSSNTLPSTITQTNLSPTFRSPIVCSLKIA